MKASINAPPSPLPEAAPAPAHAAYVPEIDGLRAFAMTAVVLQHCALFPSGWLGVWLFYVISGFAITTSLMGAEQHARDKGLMVRNFLIRRALRIWPIYFLFILVNIAIAMAWGATDFSEAGYLATFTYNFRIIAHGVSWMWVGHLWTISVEEHFYLVFPFIFAFLTGKRRLLALWALVAAAPILRLAMTPLVDALPFTAEQKAVAVYMFSPAHFDGFALGALIALGRAHIQGKLEWARRSLIAGLVLIIAYCAYGVWLNVKTGHSGVDLFRDIISGILWRDGRQVLVYIVATWGAAALVFAVAAGSPTLKRLLSLPGLQAIGRISFGAYVFHIIVVYYANYLLPHATGWSPLRQAALFLLSYPTTLALAALSFRFLERPVLSLRKKFA